MALARYTWVTPVDVSNVSSDDMSRHGAAVEPVVTVKVTTLRTSVRVPDAPTLAKGRLAEKVCPLVTVNDVADPMAVPLELTNPMVPVQDAAAPLEDAVATFTTLTCKVSEPARPIGDEADSTVAVELVVVVCASAQVTVNAPMAESAKTNRRKYIFTSVLES